MMNLFGLGKSDENTENNDNKEGKEEGTLQLREERLDVNKTRSQAGEVTLSKDVIEEERTIDVPLTHEEVVIERKSFNNEHSDSPITSGETISIPVSEEHVNVDKHTVLTGEISAHKHDVEETKHIEETVKKEKASIDSTGAAKIITE
jgi:uncharacterized protein (TIGR02271 family)